MAGILWFWLEKDPTSQLLAICWLYLSVRFARMWWVLGRINEPEKIRVMVRPIGPAHAQRSSSEAQATEGRLATVAVADGGQRAQNLDLGTRHCGLPSSRFERAVAWSLLGNLGVITRGGLELKQFRSSRCRGDCRARGGYSRDSYSTFWLGLSEKGVGRWDLFIGKSASARALKAWLDYAMGTGRDVGRTTQDL